MSATERLIGGDSFPIGAPEEALLGPCSVSPAISVSSTEISRQKLGGQTIISG